VLPKKNISFFSIFLLFYLNIAFADECPLTISDSYLGFCEITTPRALEVNLGGVISNSGALSDSYILHITNDMSYLINNGTIESNVTSGARNKGLYFMNLGTPKTVESLINNGDIKVTGLSDGNVYSIYIDTNQKIETLVNNGTIKAESSVGSDTYGIFTSCCNSSITSLTNNGLIIGGIGNFSYDGINTLNNAQGESSALVLSGELPTNYNIKINNSSNYGKLNVISGYSLAGHRFMPMNFDIYPGSVITSNKYNSVLSGLLSSDISSLMGVYGRYTWTLSETTLGSGIWDLLFPDYVSGPSSSDTQSSLTRLASRLRSSYNSASLTSNFPNSNTYDCNLFDVKGMCISAGGRYSTVDNPSSNSTAAVVTLGYKVSPSIRIGGFLDQSVNNNNPTGINLSNKNPMMGAFAYWNQKADGLGYQVKIANAYQDKDLSTTRDVIGTSEAGTGKTSLTTQSYVGELSYAFMYKENTLVRPYFALRHTSIEQDAYTETGIATPLTYSALNDRTTSALMGVKFKHALTPKANLIGSLGVEQDLHHKTDQLTATGVSGLTSENFSGNIHRTRPVASVGATYDIAKTQRLSGEVLVQQLPFQSTTGATAYFNYMIGF